MSLRDRPISKLGRKNIVCKWTEQHQQCFKEIKEAIRENIPLEPYESSANSIVFTYAFTSEVRYVFVQTTNEEKVKIVS